MSSQVSSPRTPSTLPIINIAPYLNSDDVKGRALTSVALHAACMEYGFFYLDVSAYIDQSQPEELISLARKFFFLSQEEKDKIALKNEDYARGIYASHLVVAFFGMVHQVMQGSKKM
jgi:isopenicillin N synthase-like dioxygenase